jgi:uncharacterized protein YjbI with pentapeptide repeats
MNPSVEAALISAAATIVSVLATAAVAIVGFRTSRSTTDRALTAADANLRQTLDTTRDGQIADLYGRAVEQLGSGNQDVRIGGIYALERVARDSARDHPTVMEVLTAFIRVHSYTRPSHEHPTKGDVSRETRDDVQAAVTVVARRDTGRDIRSIDLTGARLPGADLIRAKFASANLRNANLAAGDLTGANLRRADLRNANLTGAKLAITRLRRADFRGAKLNGATLRSADLTNARLDDADLTGADLTGGDLTGGRLARANLTDANLIGVKLIGVNLNDAKLIGAKWPTDSVPEGWELDAAGRLKSTSIGSAPSESE